MIKKQKQISWKDVDKSVLKIVEMVKQSGFKPDYLVGIAVGGLIPVTLLAKKLKTHNVVTIQACSYEKQKQNKVKVINLPNINLKNKKILLVDEIADSGNTLKAVSTILVKEYGIKQIKTATLAINPEKCKFVPDFYTIKTDCWIVFPWEAKE